MDDKELKKIKDFSTGFLQWLRESQAIYFHADIWHFPDGSKYGHKEVTESEAFDYFINEILADIELTKIGIGI